MTLKHLLTVKVSSRSLSWRKNKQTKPQHQQHIKVRSHGNFELSHYTLLENNFIWFKNFSCTCFISVASLCPRAITQLSLQICSNDLHLGKIIYFFISLCLILKNICCKIQPKHLQKSPKKWNKAGLCWETLTFKCKAATSLFHLEVMIKCINLPLYS